ncbi:hypothetical protein ACJJIW_20795 [Microbulbifer sp. JMSA004]|uniref:hypothetical protein n=1 Tax=unclassified Microbulbifer TaxID=2619833 RepID=UPI0024AE5B48|nr:hypothetical protein [Microbulbifer sp. VAAF005]WHI46431.1 hypothetical protein P0078_22420 [Microbulbifer sp. VAAF005]
MHQLRSSLYEASAGQPMLRAACRALNSKSMFEEYSIIEKFEVIDRGVVVVIAEVTDRAPGEVYRVKIRSASEECIEAEAVKEWLLCKDPVPIEKEAYVLKGVHEYDLQENAVLVFF